MHLIFIEGKTSVQRICAQLGIYSFRSNIHCEYYFSFHYLKVTKASIICWLIELQDGEAYAYLLNVLAPEHCSPATLDTKDPTERAKLILEHAERMNCKRYLTPKDIVEGSPNLNLAFVAHIFHHR